MKNRQNILCLNTVQLSTKRNNIFSGRVGRGLSWLGSSWLGAKFARGQVCKGPNLLGAEMSRNQLNNKLEFV